MAFTYDVATERGKVRLMIPDKVEAGHLFEDDEVDAFLAMEGANLKRATALALETAASDQALVLKVIRMMDLTTDGAKVSDALLKRAAELRRQADEDENAQDGGGFDWAEMVLDPFSERDRRYNEALRNG